MASHKTSRSRVVRTIVVVDDHKTFSDLLSLALSGEQDLECVGTAHDRSSALQLVSQHRPDVVVMDVDLGGDNGIAVTAELTSAYPDLSVVILTAHATRDLAMQAAAADASCLLPKNGALPDLLKALRSARRGGFIVDPALLRALVTQTPPSDEEPLQPLTPRELTVLQLLVMGKDTAAIARELNLSVHTYRGYVQTLVHKLGARSQLEAVVIAIRRGIVNV